MSHNTKGIPGTPTEGMLGGTRNTTLKGWLRTLGRAWGTMAARVWARTCHCLGGPHPDAAPLLRGWLVPVVLLGTMAYCLAEEITP